MTFDYFDTQCVVCWMWFHKKDVDPEDKICGTCRKAITDRERAESRRESEYMERGL